MNEPNVDLTPAITALQATIQSLKQQRDSALKPYRDSLDALRKQNTVCERCHGEKYVLRPRACAEDDLDPDDPRDRIKCPECNGTGVVPGQEGKTELNILPAIESLKNHVNKLEGDYDKKISQYKEALNKIYGADDTCPVCEGKGKVLIGTTHGFIPNPDNPNDWKRCLKCNGTGKVRPEKRCDTHDGHSFVKG